MLWSASLTILNPSILNPEDRAVGRMRLVKKDGAQSYFVMVSAEGSAST